MPLESSSVGTYALSGTSNLTAASSNAGTSDEIVIVRVFALSNVTINTPTGGSGTFAALSASPYISGRGKASSFWKRLSAQDTGNYTVVFSGSTESQVMSEVHKERVTSGNPFTFSAVTNASGVTVPPALTGTAAAGDDLSYGVIEANGSGYSPQLPGFMRWINDPAGSHLLTADRVAAGAKSVQASVTSSDYWWVFLDSIAENGAPAISPTMVASYSVYQTGSNNTALVTPLFTPNDKEVLVCKVITGTAGQVIHTPVSSANGHTWATRASDATASHCGSAIYTTTQSGAGSAMTVTMTPTGTGVPHSMVVERWSNAQLAATPATNSTKIGTGTSIEQSLTSVGVASVVSWCVGDWAAVAGPARTLDNNSGGDATEDGYTTTSGQYTGYYGYQYAEIPDVQPFGVANGTATSSTWSVLGIELQAYVAPIPTGWANEAWS